MANPYDELLRERAVRAYEGGRGTYEELADLFGVAGRTIARWVALRRVTGSTAPSPKGGGWRSPIDREVMRQVIADAPDAICAELCREYNRRVPPAHRTTLTSLWRAMRREGYVLKKNGRGRVKSTGPTCERNAPRS